MDIDRKNDFNPFNDDFPPISPKATFDRKVKLNDLELALIGRQNADKLVILVHGFTGSKEDFSPWLAPICSLGFSVVIYDQRGHGQSSKLSDPFKYSVDLMADDLLNLIEKLGHKHVIALGHSLGGMVLGEAMIKSPSTFLASILMDTHYGPIELPKEILFVVDEIVAKSGVEGLLKAAKAIGMLDSDINFKNIVSQHPEYETFTERKFLATDPAAFTSLGRSLSNRPNRLKEYSKLDVKTLIVCGENDISFLDASRQMANSFKNSTLAIIENAGHLPQFENHKQWWAVISNFIIPLAKI
jgi:pimeloyl-ACP methyl ester carboxylesterase